VVQKGDTIVLAPARHLRAEGGGVEETDSAVIRYNVTAVDGLFGANDLTMTIRFRDEGKSARVIAQLIEVNIMTGAEVTLLTFDSDTVPGQSGYQTHGVTECGRREELDFVEHAYYIEATLTNSSLVLGSAAGIEIIQLQAMPCFP
jgi:hypothetical protein